MVPKGASLRTLREMLAQKTGLVGDQGVDDGAPSDGTHDAPSSARSRQEGEYGGESDSSSADDEEKAGCNKIENKPPVAILVEGTKSVDQQEHEGPLRLARATPGGPPLDPGRAAQLEWIGAARDNMECPVSGPPLSLRDGAVVGSGPAPKLALTLEKLDSTLWYAGELRLGCAGGSCAERRRRGASE